MSLSIKILSRRSAPWPASDAWAALRHRLAWPARFLAARRVMLRLGALSDHELKDIGLYRQDLRDVSGLPADADPGQALRRKVERRRRWN